MNVPSLLTIFRILPGFAWECSSLCVLHDGHSNMGLRSRVLWNERRPLNSCGLSRKLDPSLQSSWIAKTMFKSMFLLLFCVRGGEIY